MSASPSDPAVAAADAISEDGSPAYFTVTFLFAVPPALDFTVTDAGAPGTRNARDQRAPALGNLSRHAE